MQRSAETSTSMRRILGAIAAIAFLACTSANGTDPNNPAAVIVVTVASAQLRVGDQTQATAEARDANGAMLAHRSITWSTSDPAVATVNATGVVTAAKVGSVDVIASSQGVNGSAHVIVSAPPPPAATKLGIVTQPGSTAASGAPLAPQPVIQLQDASGSAVTSSGVSVTATVATGSGTLSGTTSVVTNATGVATFTNLVITGSGAHSLRFSAAGLTSATSSAIAVSPPSSNSQLLFSENFEDSNFGGRGWYDLPTGGITTLSTTNHITGSTRSLQVDFAQGATTPTGWKGARHLFTPSDGVYIRYWVRFSSNWVGSGKPYHPHEFLFMTTEDGDYIGPSATHLTLYVEENFQSDGGYPLLQAQDALNIDATKVGVDLTNLTENRAVSGCNGDQDGTASQCYQIAPDWYNGKVWKPSQAAFLQNPGPAYKGDWHKVEAYFKLNSIVSGKGQLDGIAQYWLDGQLIIDRHNLVFRTGLHTSMKINQLLMAPYIGDGSPVSQTLWYDDMVVMTAPPTS